MRFKKNQKATKVRDTRNGRTGSSSRSGTGAGILSLLPMAVKMLGIKGTIIAAIVAVGLLFILPKGCSSQLLSLLSGSPNTQTTSQTQTATPSTPEDKKSLQFIHNVKFSTDAVWKAELGPSYRDPSLNVMTDRKGTGPYYMPHDETIYIDPSFFTELEKRHDSPGDFARGYVLAHEAAHHVQKLLGLTTYVHSRRGNNELSVRLELYADFLSGVWAKKAQEMGLITMEEGDIEEGLNAANNIGDDVLMKKAGAWKIDPKKFTHGTGKQRKAWLLYGYHTGDWKACDLFLFDSKGNVSVGPHSLMPPAR